MAFVKQGRTSRAIHRAVAALEPFHRSQPISNPEGRAFRSFYPRTPDPFSIGMLAEQYLKGVYAACFALHILEFVFLPPARYPDLFPVLNVLISTPIFVLTWLWSMKSLIEARWTVGGLGLGTRSRRPSMSDKGHSDVQTPATEDGIASMIPRGIGREFGLRAQSLGYRSGKRRAPVSRAASVGFAD